MIYLSIAIAIAIPVGKVNSGKGVPGVLHVHGVHHLSEQLLVRAVAVKHSVSLMDAYQHIGVRAGARDGACGLHHTGGAPVAAG